MNLAILSGLILPPTVEPAAHHAAGALISGLWEGLLLAGATAVLLRVVPGTTARLRFAVWTMVFLVLAALPLASAFHSGSAAEPTLAAAPLRHEFAPLRLDPSWSYALAGLWMAAVVFRLGSLGVQAARLRRLWRSAVPVSAEAVTGLGVPLGKAKICTSAELDRPSVIGFFAPRILIPEWLFGQLTPGELHQIVLHEMEHLRRRDDWMNLVQKIGLVLFPLNPALVWIDRRLATERELACDDGVLNRTHAPRAYATCLTSLAERRLAHRRHGRLTALALGALGAIRRSEFSRRIEIILGRRPGLSPAMGRAVAGVFAAGVLAAGGALAHAPELVAFAPVAPPGAESQFAAIPALGEPLVDAKGVRTARMESVVFRPQTGMVTSKAVAISQPAAPAAVNNAKKAPRVPLKRAGSALDPGMEPMAHFDQVVQRQMKEQRRLMLLTDWQEPVTVPVVITLPDGRTFFATYTATPTQAGWIVVQL